MQLLSIRRWYTDSCTISELFLNMLLTGLDLSSASEAATLSIGPAIRECFVLEDTVRAPGVKIQNETAIPAGRYRMVVDWSNRFKKYAFHILDVPNYAGIRMHSGNTDKDTDGCLLVGDERALNAVFGSHKAFISLWEKLTEEAGFNEEHGCQSFRMKEETWITIKDSPEQDTREAQP
jgi:Steigviridae/Suoliviridae L,D-carboxypeptidase/transpeptidase